jgi:hypothetical protein
LQEQLKARFLRLGWIPCTPVMLHRLLNSLMSLLLSELILKREVEYVLEVSP